LLTSADLLSSAGFVAWLTGSELAQSEGFDCFVRCHHAVAIEKKTAKRTNNTEVTENSTLATDQTQKKNKPVKARPRALITPHLNNNRSRRLAPDNSNMFDKLADAIKAPHAIAIKVNAFKIRSFRSSK
jgi:hypothetical protein